MEPAKIEERLGKLEVQMARVEGDVAEIKTDQKIFIREIRLGFDDQRDRSQALELSMVAHHSTEERGQEKGNRELGEQGRGIDEALRRIPGATFLGRHGSRLERYAILIVLGYLLKIVTIDIDLPRLNKFIATSNAVGAIEAHPLPASPTTPTR